MNRLCECLFPIDREIPEIRLVCEEAPETLAIPAAPAGPEGPETPDGFEEPDDFEEPDGSEDPERPEDPEGPRDLEDLEDPEGPEEPRDLEDPEGFEDLKGDGDGAGGEGIGGDFADPPDLGDDAELRVVVQRVGDSGIVGALREYSAAEWRALGRSRGGDGGGAAALEDERVTFVAPGLVVRAAPGCESVEIFAGEAPVACGDRAILKITLSGTARDRETGALTVRDVRAAFYATPRIARDSWTSSEAFRPHIAEALRLLRVYLGADVRLAGIAPASPGVSPRR